MKLTTLILATLVAMLMSVPVFAQVGEYTPDPPATVETIPQSDGRVQYAAVPAPRDGRDGQDGIDGKDGKDATTNPDPAFNSVRTRTLWINGRKVVIRADGTLATNAGRPAARRHAAPARRHRTTAKPNSIVTAIGSAVSKLNETVFGAPKKPGLNDRVGNLEYGFEAVSKAAGEAKTAADNAATAAGNAADAADNAQNTAGGASLIAIVAIILAILALIVGIVAYAKRKREVGVSKEDFSDFAYSVNNRFDEVGNRLDEIESRILTEPVTPVAPPVEEAPVVVEDDPIVVTVEEDPIIVKVEDETPPTEEEAEAIKAEMEKKFHEGEELEKTATV